MSKTALFLTTALAVSGGVAVAAPTFPTTLPNGVTISKGDGGQLIARTNAPTGRATGQQPYSLPGGHSAISSLWSREKNAPYIPFNGTLVICFISQGGACWSQAQAFTPDVSADTKSVTLPLMAASSSGHYTYQADVSIYTDAEGLPGTALATATVSAPAALGDCCSPVKAKLKVSLTAGTQYWIVVAPHSSTDAVAWAEQDADFVNLGLGATNQGGGWISFQSNMTSAYLIK